MMNFNILFVRLDDSDINSEDEFDDEDNDSEDESDVPTDSDNPSENVVPQFGEVMFNYKVTKHYEGT